MRKEVSSRSEVREQRVEVRKRKQKAEGRRQRAEGRGQQLNVLLEQERTTLSVDSRSFNPLQSCALTPERNLSRSLH